MSTKIQKQNGDSRARNTLELRPAADIYEGEHDFKVVLDVPGVAKQGVNVSVERDTMSVSAERRDGEETVRYVRSFSLPNTVDANAVSAEMSAGVLSVTLPKLEAVKPRQVEVRAS